MVATLLSINYQYNETLKPYFQEIADEMRNLPAHLSDEFVRRVDTQNLSDIVGPVLELRLMIPNYYTNNMEFPSESPTYRRFSSAILYVRDLFSMYRVRFSIPFEMM